MNQNLALFDFDGTISRKDSMIEFLKFYSGKLRFYCTFLAHAHWLLLMYAGFIKKSKVKEKIWVSIFGNTNVPEFNEVAEKFSLEILPSILYPDAVHKIEKHKEEGDRIVIVSASAENWLKPWCTSNNLELISTNLEITNGIITGKIDGNNCNGSEKVVRIKQKLNLSDYSCIYAYGNSKEDKPMLSLASHPYYKAFS